MAAVVTSRLSLLVTFVVVVVLPLPTKLEYADMRQPPVNISMLNDDLIVPKTGTDCPEPDEIGCTEIQSKNNDALIYPTSKLSTAKPALSTRRQAEAPLNTQTSPTRSFDARGEKPCSNDDDEDCSETSGDGRAFVSAGGGGNSPAVAVDDTVLSNRRSTQVISEPRSPASAGGDGDWPGGAGGESSATGVESPETNDTGRLPLPGDTTDEGEEEGVYDGGSTPSSPGSGAAAGPSSQKTFADSIRNHYQLAINMNIILIVGIAIGIVILLLILIVAICKYKGQGGAKAPPMGKSDRAKSYTYEACNTGPPIVASPVAGGGGDPGEPGKTKSSTSIAVGLPTSPGAAGNTTTITAPGTTTAGAATAAPHSKPARKGVKEWYV